jgi:hypothetical protein
MSGIKPALDPAIAVAYIRQNFEPADRLAVVVLNKRTNSVAQRIAAAQQITEPDFQSWLRYRNNRDRCEIFISMNALHPNALGRTKQDVAAIRHVYLDFDVNGTAALERLLKREDVPKPNYLIVHPTNGRSSGKLKVSERNRLSSYNEGSPATPEPTRPPPTFRGCFGCRDSTITNIVGPILFRWNP